MKVLLMAYECSPYHGSEWGVGWGRLLQASRVAETHVLTSAASFADLQRARQEGLLPANVHPATPRLERGLADLLTLRGRFDYNYRAYRQWQRCALDLARELHAKHTFDVAHQTTVCTFREPGFAWRLGIPFLWGPFGGTQNFPMGMLSLLPANHALYEAARSVANKAVLRFSPHVRSAVTRASAILVANSTNAHDCSRAFQRPVQQLLETGIADVPEPDRTRYHRRAQSPEPRPLRLLWSGQLRPRKALPVLLHALARLRGRIDFTLDVMGSGSEEQPWRRLAHRLGLDPYVHFRGRLPLSRAIAAMHTADVFCFTSLRDTSGNVVLEALAAGVPVVAFDHQGAADMVTADCGMLLPVTSPRTAIHAWAEAIATLALDPALLLRLSEGTTAQARKFLWTTNGDHVNRLYRQLADERPSHRAAHPSLSPWRDAVQALRPGPAW